MNDEARTTESALYHVVSGFGGKLRYFPLLSIRSSHAYTQLKCPFLKAKAFNHSLFYEKENGF